MPVTDPPAWPPAARGMGASIVVAAWLLSLTTAMAAVADAHDIYIEDHRLHIECSGRGAPVVVLDPGLGGSSLEWVFVVERLRRLTQVCTYDRAGYGRSDMGPLPRTSSRIAHELERLLAGAGVPAPYILVGHSFGGYNMQMFARRNPALTAGLVLIDASHPDQVERFEAPPLNIVTAPSSRFGIVQFSNQPPPKLLALPARVRELIRARAQRWKTRRTLASELLSFRDSAAEVRAAPPLGATPLIVISRGKIEGEATTKRVLFEQVWLDLQSELAASSATSAQLLARNSGHHIHLEQPDLVAFAIGMLVERARGPAATSHWSSDFAARSGVDFMLTDATWLKDDLSLFPPPVLAVVPATPCTATCGDGGSGAP